MSKKHNYDEYYRQYRNLVLKTAYDYSGDMYTAEDIMQDTFEKLYEKIDTMEITNLASWLITTAKRKAINESMKQGRSIPDSERVEESADSQLMPSVEWQYFKNEAHLERISLYQQIVHTMEEKNSKWSEAIDVVYRMGIPREKAAKQMGVSIGVLDSRLHRAKEWVKREYGVVLKEIEEDEPS